MQITKILSTVAIALLAFGQGAMSEPIKSFPTASGGNGTTSDPFIIASISDLNTLASDVNSGTTYENYYFKLTGDLDYSTVALFDSDEDGTPDSNFTPIGIVEYDNGTPITDKAFKGVFDGNDKTISGVQISHADGEAVGLFGNAAYPGVIKNLKVENSSFVGNYCVGAIVGEYNNCGNTQDVWGIYHCHVGSGVTVEAATYGDGDDALPGWYAGGIAGTSNLATVENCVSAATVKGDEYVGGITGQLYKDTSGYMGELIDCYYTGNGVTASTDLYAGPVCGVNGMVNDDDEIEDGTSCTPTMTLLDDDSDETIKNATRISNYKSLKVNVTLSGRTLYKDTGWNTLCLPFPLDDITDSPLESAKVKTLTGASFKNGTLTLNFDEISTVEAGKPFIIKWDPAQPENEVSPLFHDVTITTASPGSVKFKLGNSSMGVEFKGVFDRFDIEGENRSLLYMGADNTLYYPNAAMTIGAFRAYFELYGLTAGDLENGINNFVLNFGEETNSIEEISNLKSQTSNPTGWYTLDGRELNSKPTTKGIYINNGKKVVVK